MKISDGKMVAKVRATKKGKKLQVGTVAIGCKGQDGRKWYEIRNAGRGLWTCSCMAYRFSPGVIGRKLPCKHLKKVKGDWMSGRIGEDIIIYEPGILSGD